MPPAARIGDAHLCPMVNPGPAAVPHVGMPIAGPGAPTVLIEGMPAAVVGDLCPCAGPPDGIAAGSSGVFLEGKPAARMGDMTNHGGQITLGSFTVLIGESGGGGGGGGGAGPQEFEVEEAEPVEIPEELEIELVDEEGTPISYAAYLVTLEDGTERKGHLDVNGYAWVHGVAPGQCKVTFPEMEGRDWDSEG